MGTSESCIGSGVKACQNEVTDRPGASGRAKSAKDMADLGRVEAREGGQIYEQGARGGSKLDGEAQLPGIT